MVDLTKYEGRHRDPHGRFAPGHGTVELTSRALLAMGWTLPLSVWGAWV